MPEEARQAALRVRQQRSAIMKVEKMEAVDFESALTRALDDPGLNCYAIIDPAQDASLLLKF